MSFSYNIQELEQLSILSLKGRMMDADDPKKVLEVVETSIKNNKINIVLNLKELEYMNSSGINAFVSILTKTRNNGGDTVICCLSKKIEQLLLITKLNSLFTITETEEQAINKLSENINA